MLFGCDDPWLDKLILLPLLLLLLYLIPSIPFELTALGVRWSQQWYLVVVIAILRDSTRVEVMVHCIFLRTFHASLFGSPNFSCYFPSSKSNIG